MIARLAISLLLLLSPSAHGLTLQDHEENEYTIQQHPAEGKLLALWFTDLADESRPHFQALLSSMAAEGIEVWSTRMLEDLFLTRDDATIMKLDGSRIAALIAAATEQTDKEILLVSYDKMSIPLLRGVRHWQQHYPHSPQLVGSALHYPNLFIAPTRAGASPTPAPILSLTNTPVALFQPTQGQHAKRANVVMETLWEAGAAATLQPLSDIRDWYLMHKPGQYPAEAPVRAALPRQHLQLAQQMRFSPFPEEAVTATVDTTITVESDPYRLIPTPTPSPAPDFQLADADGAVSTLQQYRGKVVLLNFWASWCPPCIEELPSMNQIHQRYQSKGLEIIALNFQESPEQITEFMQKVAIDFPVLFDQDGGVAHQWNVFSMPTSFLIDRQGNIRYSVSRSIHWDLPEHTAVLESLLEE